jgi:prepilin-type processing-associated H-X9-DG protein
VGHPGDNPSGVHFAVEDPVMTLPARWHRLVGAAVAVVAAISLALVPDLRTASAQPPALPPELKMVPPDAALFGHVNVAAVWSGKIGDTVRAAKPVEIEKGLAELKKKTGVSPDMVKTVTFFFPNFKQPGDFNAGVVHVTFQKPYDRATILKSMKDEKTEFTEENGVVTIKEKSGPGGVERKIVFDLSDANRIAIYAGVDDKYRKPAAGDGPIAPAIRAAAEGATAAFGVNFAALPDEIRGDDLPAEVRPFQPLFKSDALIAVGKLEGEELKVDLRFRSSERARVAEAEKSLAAGITLFQTLLGIAVQQLENSKNENEKAMLPLVKQAIEVVRGAKVSADGSEARVSGVVRTDLPIGSFLQFALGGATGPAGRAQDQNNLKQLALAMHNYHDTYNGFPPAAVCDKRGKPMLSWRVLLLPYVEQDHVYKQFKLDEPWDSTHNKAVFDKNPMPKVFQLPGTPDGEKLTHYQVFVKNGALFDPLQATKIQSITDGTSNTVLIATAAKGVPWTKPDDLEFDPKADPRTLLKMDTNGCNVAFADGSVRFLAKTIDPDVLKAIITKGGGEAVNLND